MNKKVKWGCGVKVFHPGIQKTVVALANQLRRLEDQANDQTGGGVGRKPAPVEEALL